MIGRRGSLGPSQHGPAPTCQRRRSKCWGTKCKCLDVVGFDSGSAPNRHSHPPPSSPPPTLSRPPTFAIRDMLARCRRHIVDTGYIYIAGGFRVAYLPIPICWRHITDILRYWTPCLKHNNALYIHAQESIVFCLMKVKFMKTNPQRQYKQPMLHEGKTIKIKIYSQKFARELLLSKTFCF